jgi:outer membrane immunogenic protein
MTMRRFIKLSFVTMMLVSVPAVSEAADVLPGSGYRPPPPAMPLIYNWTGFYVGGQLGLGWASGGNGSSGSSGVLGGGQVGFNYQIDPQWVLGVEADIAGPA